MNQWQIAWRNLMRRKLRTFLTVLSIVIGVASTFAVLAAVDSAEKAFPAYLKAAFGKADYVVQGTEAYFSEDVHTEVETLDGVATIAVLKENTKVHIEQEELSAIQKRVVLNGYSDLDTPLTDFKLVEGDLAAGGAVITDRTAEAWGTGVGDMLSFDTDNGQKTIEVTAIVNYTKELMGPSSWDMAKYHPWSIAVPLSVAQEWFGLSNQVQSVQIKAADPAELQTIEQQLDGIVKNLDGVYMQPVVIDVEAQFQTADSFFLALYIAGFLGIALSAFVIFNSLYVSIKERKNEFAVLKTIGYTPAQLQSMVLFEVLLLSIIGTVLGLLVGFGLAFVLKSLIFMIYGIEDGSGMVLTTGLYISVLAGMLVPLLAASYPIRQAGRASVIDVLKENRAAAPVASKGLAAVGILLILSSFFIKHLLLVLPLMLGITFIFPYLFKAFSMLVNPIYHLLFPFEGGMATRNLRRNMGRTAMTSVVLALGIAMIMLMSSMNTALLQTYERVIYSSYGGNLDVMFHHMEEGDLEKLRSTAGVADATSYSVQAAVWSLNEQNRILPVYGVGEGWIDRFPLFTSETPPEELVRNLKADEVILDKIAFSAWEGKIGEQITLETLNGLKSFKVAAVVDTMKNSGYGAFMKEGQFKENFGLEYEKNALVLKDENMSPLQLRENIFDQFGERIVEMFGPEDWVSVISATYTGSFTIVNALVVLAIIVSGIGITNTLLMNIMERIREIGMMRAVGVTRRQIIHMILLEGLGIGMTATVIGSLFGILLVYMTSTFMEVNSLTFEFGVSWIVLLLTISFGLLVSLISSYIPARKAAKTQLSEALRHE